jgi:hypothetical protein
MSFTKKKRNFTENTVKMNRNRWEGTAVWDKDISQKMFFLHMNGGRSTSEISHFFIVTLHNDHFFEFFHFQVFQSNCRTAFSPVLMHIYEILVLLIAPYLKQSTTADFDQRGEAYFYRLQ